MHRLPIPSGRPLRGPPPTPPTLIGLVMTVNAVAGFLVPLAVGVWSDRRAASGLGRRLPFMIGGTLVAAGGLVALAAGCSRQVSSHAELRVRAGPGLISAAGSRLDDAPLA